MNIYRKKFRDFSIYLEKVIESWSYAFCFPFSLFFLYLINDSLNYGIIKLEVSSNKTILDRIRKCLGEEVGFRIIRR